MSEDWIIAVWFCAIYSLTSALPLKQRMTAEKPLFTHTGIYELHGLVPRFWGVLF